MAAQLSSAAQASRSEELFERARALMPGGVSSPVRAFGAVGGTPRVIRRARGCRLEDVDGRSYVDYICSWGALILGHGDPFVKQAGVHLPPSGYEAWFVSLAHDGDAIDVTLAAARASLGSRECDFKRRSGEETRCRRGPTRRGSTPRAGQDRDTPL